MLQDSKIIIFLFVAVIFIYSCSNSADSNSESNSTAIIKGTWNGYSLVEDGLVERSLSLRVSLDESGGMLYGTYSGLHQVNNSTSTISKTINGNIKSGTLSEDSIYIDGGSFYMNGKIKSQNLEAFINLNFEGTDSTSSYTYNIIFAKE